MKKRVLFFLTLVMLSIGIQKSNAQSGYTGTWNSANSTGLLDWKNVNKWNITPVFGYGFYYPGQNYNNDIVDFTTNASLVIDAALVQGSVYSIVVSSGVTVNLTINSGITLSVLNSIQLGTNSTLNIIGPGSIIGTSAISLATGATLTTTGGCNITAASITAIKSTITLAGKLTLSGNLTVNYPGTTTLTTNSANNTIPGGITVNYNGANIGNLTWNGSGSTTVGASGGSSVNAGCTFTVGSGNTITFNQSLSFQTTGNTAATLASLVNSGNLTFAGCNLSGQNYSSAGSPNTYVTNNSGGVITISGSGSRFDVPAYLNVSNSGTITANSGCTINMGAGNDMFTNNSNGTVNLTGGASGATFNLNANPSTLINNGTMNFSAASSLVLNQPNAAATNALTMLFDASTLSLTANPCNFTNTSTGGITLQNVSALSLSSANSSFTNAGAITLTSTAFATPTTVTMTGNPSSITSTGTINATYATINLNAAHTIFTNDVSGVLHLTSCAVNLLVNPSTFTNNAVMTSTSTPFVMSGQNAAFNNNSGASLMMAASPFTISGGTCTFNNSGSVQASGGCNFTLNGNSGSSINNNAGTFQISGSNINLGINTSYLNNSASFTATLCTFTTAASGSNGIITNNSSGAFSSIGSTFTLSTQGGAISNAGTFTATASGATPTIFNLNSTSSPGANITNTSTGLFNVGLDNSLSTITLGSSGTNTITNNQFFNLGPLSTIYMTSGNAKITNAAGTFTLMSTALGSATIGTLATGASCTGNFSVQRYITGGAGYRGYRILTSPVNINSLISQTASIGYIGLDYLGAGLLTGGPGSGFDVTTTNPLIYFYNESRTQNFTAYVKGKNVGVNSITGSSGTPAYSITTYGTNLATTYANIQVPVGNSYQLYFVGNTSNTTADPTPNPATVTALGYLNQGTIPVHIFNGSAIGAASSSGNLSYSSPPNTAATGLGLNQVGNPYASTIDLDSLYYDNGPSNGSNINPIFWELKEPTNTFVAYSAASHAASTTGSGAGAYIVSGQGFFVGATNTGKTLTFYEKEKVNVQLIAGGSPPLVLSQRLKNTNSISAVDEVEPTGLAGLHLQINNNSAVYTQTGIYFNKSWSDKFSPQEDAIDLDGTAPKVFLSSYSQDGLRLCINQLGDYSKGKTIKLYAAGTTSGTYTISLADINNIDALYNVYLRDHKLNDSVDLRTTNSYNFTIVTSDTTTYGANRFDLVLERRALPPYQLLSFVGQKVSRGVQLNWVANNTGNYTGFILEKQISNNNYTPIYTVQSDSSINYSFVDKNPVIGNNIYRLAQNDINGNITYSSLITIGYNSISSNGFFDIYPNPVKDIMNVSLNSVSAAALNYTADIYNTSGVLMDHRSLNTNLWTEDVSAYKEGVYIIELKSTKGDTLGKSKFIKIK